MKRLKDWPDLMYFRFINAHFESGCPMAPQYHLGEQLPFSFQECDYVALLCEQHNDSKRKIK
jgi:hypothetical protein